LTVIHIGIYFPNYIRGLLSYPLFGPKISPIPERSQVVREIGVPIIIKRMIL